MPTLCFSRTVEQPRPSLKTPNGFILHSVNAYKRAREFSQVCVDLGEIPSRVYWNNFFLFFF